MKQPPKELSKLLAAKVNATGWRSPHQKDGFIKGFFWCFEQMAPLLEQLEAKLNEKSEPPPTDQP